MMNPRQLMCTGAAALFASIPKARAATYDLLIKGGRVIDPSVGLDAMRDGAIAAGKIVAVEAAIAGDASQTIDARGKIVAPGLIDIHTHAGRSKEGPALLAQDGVTGWVDAGSAGADNIDQIATVARTGPQVGRALVNIARTGVISPAGELHDIDVANVALAQGAIARHRDVVVGVKARLSEKRGRRQRSRSAAARTRGGRPLQSPGDDPHWPIVFAHARYPPAAQARRYRHP